MSLLVPAVSSAPPAAASPGLTRSVVRLAALGLLVFGVKTILAVASSPAATHLLLLATLASLGSVASFVALTGYRSVVRAVSSGSVQLTIRVAGADPVTENIALPIFQRRRDLTIGRGEDADLKILEDTVSARHAILRLYRDGRSSVTDLGSRNGTFINGLQLRAHQTLDLEDTADLRLGQRVSIAVEVEAAQPSSRSAGKGRRSTPAEYVEWGLFALAVLAGLLFLRLHIQTADLAGLVSTEAIRVGGRSFDLAPHFDFTSRLFRFLIPTALLALLLLLKQRVLPGTSPVIVPVLAALTFVGHFQAESLSPRLFARAAQAVKASEAAGRTPTPELLGRLELLQAADKQQAVVAISLALAIAALVAYRYAFRFVAAMTSFFGGWMLLHWIALAGLVVLTLVAGTDLGTGKRLWLRLGPVTLQTIDLCKLLLACGMASFFHFHLPQLESHPRRRRLLLVGCVTLAILTVAIQRDMGGVVFLGSFAALFYGLVTGEVRRVVLAFSVLLAAGAVAYFALADWPYASIVRTRVDKALDPQANDEQLTLATIAVANGGLLGVGFGLGDAARAVPAIQSDFNIVAIAEEMGFAGASAVLLLYLALVLALFRLEGPRNNLFLQLCQKGVALSLGLQVVVIVAGDLSLIPLTGVTLPFVSLGGTSYLLTALSVIAALALEGSQWEEKCVSWS